MRLLLLEVNGHAGSRLGAVGHDVTTCTTLAGLVECLMRDGAQFELVLIDSARDARLLDDAARYAHWYAPTAQLVALGDDPVVALPFPIHIATVLDVAAL